MSRNESRPLVVFADDWGRHPSSCQHLIGKLLDHREVVWANTIGTRPPRLDWGTAKRVAGKLRQWTMPAFSRGPESSKPSAAVAAPRVISPKMWPSFRSRFGRSLNRKLLLRSLRPVFESFTEPPNVLTTLPLVADLVGELPANRWTYYCVDDFSVWPGYDGVTMQRMERDLVPKVDEIVAVSDTLVKHIGTIGKTARLLTHGVDLDHWRKSKVDTVPELVGFAPPFVVFWGVIDRRMDIEFVKQLTAKLKGGTIVFIGPKEDPDPKLLEIPGIRVLPPMPFAKLPSVANAAAVLVMPYADLPVTRAMQPLKLKEYLATGKPVVVRGLPSTRAWSECCDVCDTAEEFAAAVLARMDGELPADQLRNRERLNDESWTGKALRFERWIDGTESPV